MRATTSLLPRSSGGGRRRRRGFSVVFDLLMAGGLYTLAPAVRRCYAKPMGKSLAGTKTHENLKSAFAAESQANRRYLYFAKVADVEGHPDLAGLFRDTAEGETGHAHGHLDYLKRVGDPATGEPIGDSVSNLKASIAGATHEYTQMHPG